MAGTEWYGDSVKFAIQHPWVDGLVVLYCETAMTDPLEIAKGIHNAVKESGVTDKTVTVSYVGGEKSEKAMKWLVENGIPAYSAPDLAINAIAALREYALNKENNQDDHLDFQVLTSKKRWQ
jgi:acetyltransferase